MGTSYLEQMCVCVIQFYGEGEGREKLVSLKKTNDFPLSISFYFLQPHPWPGNTGHLCAPAVGLGHLFDRPDCLHRALLTRQCNRGASPFEFCSASGELVLAGELEPPVNVLVSPLCLVVHVALELRDLLLCAAAVRMWASKSSLVGAMTEPWGRKGGACPSSSHT